ncbi:MAG TPA: N-acetylmuramoyl-L-alanine amidase [Candidatus Saccharimonadales bacterium]|nr:N-acetylmuramoyl-L-alanine amidase [Candidatus Saccharimonadales bacterium]
MMKSLQRLVLCLAIVFQLSPAATLAIIPADQHAIDNDTTKYDPSYCSTTSSNPSSVSGDQVIRFLQALAEQESGGDPTQPGSAGSARGKYQYIDTTWQNNSQAYYPPAHAYPMANLAPENMQDAVAYIEYSLKFKELNNDLFKLAVSHFWPVANQDPSQLDIYPPSNNITPRQYANALIAKIKAGKGSEITVDPGSAPEFDKYAQKAGITLGGTSTASTPQSDTSGCQSDPCVDTGANDSGTVVLDPGHGPSKTTVDDATGLTMQETDNQPEGHDVWEVSQKIKNKLESDGYKVILTKKTENDDITFRGRANIANQNNAAIAVSIHTDGTQSYSSFQEVWPQEVGQYRQETQSGGRKTYFNNDGLAKTSKQYAQDILDARKVAAGVDVSLGHFNRNDVPSPGTISMVQLFSKIPWIYNEIGSGPGNIGLTTSQKDKYAEGLINGIEKAVKPGSSGSAATTACATGNNAAIVQTAIKYAWADGVHGHPQKPIYHAAVLKSIAEHRYVGGIVTPGNDCGGFVTIVMQNSGADPDYNGGTDPTKWGNTYGQMAYAKSHTEKFQQVSDIVGHPVNNTADLQPGDIAIVAPTSTEGHTYIYVGPQSDHPNFHGDSASASIPDRSPNADGFQAFGHGQRYTWFRLKASQ